MAFLLFLEGENYSFLSSVFVSSLLASLNSFIPLPRPLINSGIFFPPNNNKTTTTIKIICGAPIAKDIMCKLIRPDFQTKLIIKL